MIFFISSSFLVHHIKSYLHVFIIRHLIPDYAFDLSHHVVSLVDQPHILKSCKSVKEKKSKNFDLGRVNQSRLKPKTTK